MHEVETAAMIISVAYEIWALLAIAAALRRSRNIAEEGVDELAKSLTLLARDWAKQRKIGEAADATR